MTLFGASCMDLQIECLLRREILVQTFRQEERKELPLPRTVLRDEG